MVLHDQWPNSSLTASVWRGIGVNILILCPFGCVSKNQKTKTYHIWLDTGTQTTKKKKDLIFKRKCFQSYFWLLFFVLSICNLKKLSLCFFLGLSWEAPRTVDLFVWLRVENIFWNQNCFCLFSDTKGYRETAFWLYLICPSISIQYFHGLNRQFLSFDSFSLCSFPPTLSIDFIAGTEILAEVLPS